MISIWVLRTPIGREPPLEVLPTARRRGWSSRRMAAAGVASPRLIDSGWPADVSSLAIGGRLEGPRPAKVPAARSPARSSSPKQLASNRRLLVFPSVLHKNIYM